MAGLNGDIWRIVPSPNHSSLPSSGTGSAGKTNGMLDDASMCDTPISSDTAIRCDRRHGSTTCGD